MKFRDKRRINPLTLFYLKISLVISLVIVAVYFGIYLRNNRLLLHSLQDQAVSYYDLIVRVGHWNAGYGGVYVEKNDGMVSNPSLQEIGMEGGRVTIDGSILTLKNPTQMTREISELLSQESNIHFHITSMELLNKEYAPDAFEQRALHRFAAGEVEFWEVERKDSGANFRYMAPLQVEHSCQHCHVQFHNNLGVNCGGISISIPFAATEKEMALNSFAIIGLSLLTLTLLLGSTHIMLKNFGKEIKAVQDALHEASIRDELTGLHNRRFLMTRLNEEYERARRKGSALGLLMIDIDHFKTVNDTFGHQAGDEVLRSIALTLAGMLREYDVAGRYGGEEFIVIFAETSTAEMLRLGKRIREKIGQMERHGPVTGMRVTVSIGVAVLQDDDTPETLLRRVDKALYRAKDDGRNQTVLL